MLPGWLRKAIRVTNFMTSLGPIEWVVDVGVAVVVDLRLLCILVRVLVALEKAR